MYQLLIKGLMAFGTNLIITLFGEQMVQWVIFKIAHWAVSKTKTKVDDEFVDKLEEEYKKG